VPSFSAAFTAEKDSQQTVFRKISRQYFVYVVNVERSFLLVILCYKTLKTLNETIKDAFTSVH